MASLGVMVWIFLGNISTMMLELLQFCWAFHCNVIFADALPLTNTPAGERIGTMKLTNAPTGTSLAEFSGLYFNYAVRSIAVLLAFLLLRFFWTNTLQSE